MARSRAAKNGMRKIDDGMMPRMNKAKGGVIPDQEDHWMQDVHPKKGALHEELHIPRDEKIPTARLESAKHSNVPILRKRATLALNYRGL